MKKIVILTLFSFFSAMCGDFDLVPRTINPRQLDYRTSSNDVYMDDTASFESFRPDLIPSYMASASSYETLPATEYEPFSAEKRSRFRHTVASSKKSYSCCTTR